LIYRETHRTLIPRGEVPILREYGLDLGIETSAVLVLERTEGEGRSAPAGAIIGPAHASRETFSGRWGRSKPITAAAGLLC
jgi:hypothetical protein